MFYFINMVIRIANESVYGAIFSFCPVSNIQSPKNVVTFNMFVNLPDMAHTGAVL